MNRLPAKPTSKRAAELEKRVNTLTVLVVVQLVLLVVLILFEVLPPTDRNAAELNTGMDELATTTDAGAAEPFVAGAGEDAAELAEGDQPLQQAGPTEAVPDNPVRVEVLNGCGVPGLAAGFAKVLRDAGYDVRDTKNADHHNYVATSIIDRGVTHGAGRQLAEDLGISPELVRTQPNPDLVDVDVTLILGNDHNTLNLQP